LPEPDDTGASNTGPDEPEAPFSKPWHAQLFAVTHTLASAGRFDWTDWADHFAAALKHADESGAPKDGTAYYDIWLTAFEEFIIARGLADTTGLSDFKRDWTKAYNATPHGEPVELDR
jgi:nitrile hydratase accessory protein